MRKPKLDVAFSPAEQETLRHRDLSATTCVVFDILRATSTMVTALAHGAEAIFPVTEISEALVLRQRWPFLLLAGERGGHRILSDQTGSVDFDLGNSPREFTPDRVNGAIIGMTTTNGTRAIRACAQARQVLIGSFLNLGALAGFLQAGPPEDLLLVCSGTGDHAAYEDVLAAGALCQVLWNSFSESGTTDSSLIARTMFQAAEHDLLGSVSQASNARRLLSIPDLREDVAWCLQRDSLAIVAGLDADWQVRRLA